MPINLRMCKICSKFAVKYENNNVYYRTERDSPQARHA